MQSNTARIFGRSALIERTLISLAISFVAGLRKDVIQLFVANPAAAHLVAEKSQDLAYGRFNTHVP